MKLTIDSATRSQSGKSFNVKVGDKWYLAKIDSKIDTAVGKTIEAEVSDSEYNGKTMHWINEWAVSSEQAATPGGHVSTGSGAPWWMPFCSNVCAHAIQAGLIKEPADLSKWANAAGDAAVTAERDVIAF